MASTVFSIIMIVVGVLAWLFIGGIWPPMAVVVGIGVAIISIDLRRLSDEIRQMKSK